MISRIELETELDNLLEYLYAKGFIGFVCIENKSVLISSIIELIEKKILDGEKLK
jgi:hypothetical protein